MDSAHLTPAAPQGRRPGSRGTTASHDSDNFAHQAGPPSVMAQALEHHRTPRKLVLCFDGTGNKFRGDDSDSNILKIFRCLDREAGDQYHYYQPGIGTYVVSTSLSHTSLRSRIRSWYLKAKDSAIGSSFDQHVVGGYRFLMRFYNPGDEIYFFGFSRGAYIARFLAEMLDYVGLLSHGNEEMVIFAWKAFSQWQARNHDDSPEGREKRHEMYRFLKGFRETFSRPVKRIRFLGLFDTVNSVPRFEAAWMQRSKFPYTARSSAKVIRHCVSIDERRAKFRQDLMYQKRPEIHHHVHGLHSLQEKYRARRASIVPTAPSEAARGRRATLAPPTEHTFRPHSRSVSRATRSTTEGQFHPGDARSEISHFDDNYDSDDDEQDIDELWFAYYIHTYNRGGHGDVGGGWEILPGSKSASHVPLVYMIRQAEKAGLTFDPEKLIEMGLAEAIINQETDNNTHGARRGTAGETQVPDIRIDVSASSPTASQKGNGIEHMQENWSHFNNVRDFGKSEEAPRRPFHDMLHKAHVARIHDSLEFSSGLGTLPVISWKFMEYLPFRRMDLQPDGSWKPIRWPLPGGETRDIPHTARVHGSVIRRMKQDATYRPGNLIVGGGGRGMRIAPEEHGIGEWECVQGHGDPVEEVWIKKSSSPADV
ncbi:hypothetical protein F5B22DRAFT_632597 [Xylaria bambusicola]|uniref:uncharacterized protein n=1 Tax=Xylaria bambusicola TaxID=326684 RepID=UPI002008EA29|nr:uncharacterized protein F5B22DRAFT_632597 [Xylaria bambusicola]KAI0528137.1 hypothetical protein F5B22DRAFT_632597 [Xylaria bambusicola]